MIAKIRKQSDVTKNDYNYKVNIEKIDTNNNEDTMMIMIGTRLLKEAMLLSR
jgi:hypothetical protein